MDIDFQRVSKRFGWGRAGVQALSDVSWDARSGEIVGIVGPNGSGKSTTLRILLGIFAPDSGEVVIDGGALETTSEAFRNQVGYLTEERSLYKTARVHETITYFALLKGLGRAEAMRRADEMLERFELAPYRKTENRKLSKGLSQRTQLACCMAHRPRLLVLDEPFSGLDVVAAATLRSFMHELKTEGTTIILCSHQMKEVEASCDRVLMLLKGEPVLFGGLTEVRRRYSSNDVFVVTDGSLGNLAAVEQVTETPEGMKVRLRADSDMLELLEQIGRARIEVTKIEAAHRPLEEIFCQIVEEKKHELDKGPTSRSL